MQTDNFVDLTNPTLLIIGNGFDLACGLKTRYADFFNDQVNTNPTFRSVYGYMRDTIQYGDINCSWYPHNLLKETQSFSNFTIWDIVFLIYSFKASPEKIGWCDLESVISSTFEKPNNKKHVINWAIIREMIIQYEEQGSSDHFHDQSITYSGLNFSPDDSFLVETLCNSFLFKPFSTVYQDNDSFYETLLSQLLSFENRFGKYLLNQLVTNKGEYIARRDSLVLLLSDGNLPLSIETFNYLPAYGLKYSLRHIHGQISDSSCTLIFGISKPNNPQDPSYIFTKASRQFELSIRENLDKRETNFTPKTIVFFGHSLNEQDYPYFFQFFDTIELQKKHGQKIIFKYSIHDCQTKEDAIKEIKQRVERLIYAYDIYCSGNGNLLSNLVNTDTIEVREINPFSSLKYPEAS
ncbi:MAG: bacteriophage abortive infection AbiH family protein [Bacilli bacterium]|jgi:hypothetical protein|nr:bacteriophage abortive infection AbiH family protein [Bacilli bacterium]